MFEDLKKETLDNKEEQFSRIEASISDGQPAENSNGISDAEDIFREVKGIDKLPIRDDMRPVLNEVIHTDLPDLGKTDTSTAKKKIIFLGIGFLIIIGTISFFVIINNDYILSKFRGSEVENEIGQEINTDENKEQTVDTSVLDTNQPPVNNIEIKDDDGDGLSNEEEGKLGTYQNEADTDKDGLSDREEIKVYKTDPLNPDSDGDSYLDGNEVKGGYDPKGPGKLLELKNGS